MPTTHHLFSLTRWLLNAAAVVSLLLVGILILAFGACALAAGGLIHLPIPIEDIAELKGVSLVLILEAGAVACFAGIMLLALLTLLFVITAQIVKTADSDPFIADNARRLMVIAWLLLGMQIVGLAAAMAMSAFPDEINDHIQAGFDISPIGLLGVLLIFVLAQIFRRGSEMRAELEGTV